jgi:predicted TIM-barrel fold metal-dependent hydrolase
MRVITIEEHVLNPAVARASAATARELNPHWAAAFSPESGLPYTPSPDVLCDLDQGRLADMDKHGISTQVLSNLSTQQVPADVAAELARSANDTLAGAVRRHPDRFAAFAALPTTVPDAAATELERCVGELGFVGTMIMGRTEGDFLSAERFDPILRSAARLGVPIYLHPALPTRVTSADNYEAGLDPIVAARFATAAWGWHSETGVHFLHLVLSGVFDRYPELQVILGHWGEMIPWFLYRLDEALPQRATKLDRTIGDYVRHNSYYTPGGMFTEPHLRFCLDVLGPERLIYAVDYPFVGNDGAVDFLLRADLPEATREDIAHRNAERLMPALAQR